MDKEFEKKVRQKRLRAIAVAVVVIAAIVYLISGTKVEKADYTASLNQEIETAQALYEENKDNVGNGADQYAKYTVLAFAQQISEAESVASDEQSVYSDKKLAYETLKEQVKAFKNGKNDPVITEEEAEDLAAAQETKSLTCEIKDGKDITYTVDGSKLTDPVTMNLTAREEGPYDEEIKAILKELKLQGQVISFYQEGTFGGEIQVEAPMYSEEETTAYAYKVNLKKGTLTHVSDASIDLDEQTAVFTIQEGGDYVVLTKKMHKDKKEETVDIEELEEAEQTQDNSSADASDEVQNTDNAKDSEPSNDKNTSEEPTVQPEEDDDTITVTIAIRCDTLAADLSKLRDPSLEAYVPADGTILPVTEVEVEKGTTVYDVLDKVCRDEGIHLEATYTPSYGADYIEGINYLYEFDAGEQSGWMYTVNGVFPNYGCSEYVLEEGDAIVWAYTCDMGKDLGR